MVGKVSFQIKGAKELEDQLKELGPNVAAGIGDRALRAAAKPIIKEAKRLVPVRTGELRRSIVAKTEKRGRQANQRLVVIGFKPPASRRAHFIEFGTSKMAARPFIRPAMDTKAGEALQAMQEVLAAGILRGEWRKWIGTLADDESAFDLFEGD